MSSWPPAICLHPISLDNERPAYEWEITMHHGTVRSLVMRLVVVPSCCVVELPKDNLNLIRFLSFIKFPFFFSCTEHISRFIVRGWFGIPSHHKSTLFALFILRITCNHSSAPCHRMMTIPFNITTSLHFMLLFCPDSSHDPGLCVTVHPIEWAAQRTGYHSCYPVG